MLTSFGRKYISIDGQRLDGLKHGPRQVFQGFCIDITEFLTALIRDLAQFFKDLAWTLTSSWWTWTRTSPCLSRIWHGLHGVLDGLDHGPWQVFLGFRLDLNEFLMDFNTDLDDFLIDTNTDLAKYFKDLAWTSSSSWWPWSLTLPSFSRIWPGPYEVLDGLEK